MSNRVASVVLLVEDYRQEKLLRFYLRRLGHDVGRNLRVKKTLRGCGEQFVREKYAAEVCELRTRTTKACLLVMIDADTGPVDNRRRQLERSLSDAQAPSRGSQEAVLHLIPKRNVETWILSLNSIAVNEDDDYRHDKRVDHAATEQAAQTLFDWTRPNTQLPAACVPSLQACIPEFERLPKLR